MIEILDNDLPTIEAEPKWIPVSERLPKPEETVLISCKRTYFGKKKPFYFVAYAFYEDGTIWGANSEYAWIDVDNWEWDDKKDDFLIPEGWFEEVHFSDEFDAVDCKVTAWMPLPEPYKMDGGEG